MEKAFWLLVLVSLLSVTVEKSVHAIKTKHLECFANFHHEYVTLTKAEVTSISNWKSYDNQNLFSIIAIQDYPYSDFYYEALLLENNTIKNITNDFFNAVPKLTVLSLNNNGIERIEEESFSTVTNLIHLLINNNKLMQLSSNTFFHLKNLSYLSIDNSNLITLPDGIFAKNANLLQIILSGNLFTTVPENLFRNNSRLNCVDLEDVTTLASLPEGLFKNFMNLEFVILKNCNLTYLPENLFEGSINLRYIVLDRNFLQNLPEDIFKGLSNLIQLNLQYNQIEVLSQSTFRSCSSLTYLLLGHNKIRTINWQTFYYLIGLEVLCIKHNKISNMLNSKGITLLSVRKINLSNNFLTDINSNISNFLASLKSTCLSIEYLDLSYNKLKLTPKDWLKNLPSSMKNINISYNSITSLQGEDLNINQTTNLFIDLSHNNITEVHLNKYKSNNHNLFLFLDNNPLKCNCFLYDVLTHKYKNDFNFLDVSNSFISIKYSKCSDSELYKDMYIDNINPIEYNCSPSEKEIDNFTMCPGTCDLWKNQSNKTILFNCSNRNLTKAPETLCSFKNSEYLYELDLTGNSIKEIPSFQQPGYDKLTKLVLSNNEISTIPEGAFLKHNLTELKLDNNHLETLSINVLKEISFGIKSILLGNNPWRCDCEAYDFQKLMYTKDYIKDMDSIICKDSQRMLKNFTSSELCPTNNIFWISLALVLGTFITFLIIFYRFKKYLKIWLFASNYCLWFVREKELDNDKIYDAFISYSHKDEEFVVNELVPNLEKNPKPFKLCLHYRDWHAGEWIPTQIVKSIKNSRRTIIVLSPNFVTSEWGKLEFKFAFKETIEKRRTKLIVILYKDIGPLDKLDPELKLFLKMNTFAKWGDPWFWDKLLFALPHNTNGLSTESVSTHL